MTAEPRDRSVLVAVAAGVALGLPVIRVTTTLLYGVRERTGSVSALTMAAIAFAAPAAWPAIEWLLGRYAARLTLWAAALAATSMQFVHPIPAWLGVATTALILLVWTGQIRDARWPDPRRGATVAAGFVVGAIVDSALNAALGTWDAVWRTGLAATPTVALVAVLLVSSMGAWRVEPRPREGLLADVWRLGALGPYLLLQTLFLHDTAWLGSAAGIGLTAAAATVAAGQLGALLLMRWRGWESLPARVASGVVVAAVAAALTHDPGAWSVVLIVIGSALTGPMLLATLSAGAAPEERTSWRTSLAVAVGSLWFATSLFSVQIDAANPLPFPMPLVPVASALLLGGAFVTSSATPWRFRPHRGVTILAVAVALVTPLAMSLAAPAASASPVRNKGAVSILSWNVHSAVTPDGQLAPDRVAAAIEAAAPDVIVLQEVSRGWPIGGSLDLAGWLAARLDIPYVWAPAVGPGFGNAILSTLPIVDARALALPFGTGPQHRSALVVRLGAWGTTLNVVGTHLESAPLTRVEQLETILHVVSETPRTVIAGDMNMQPGAAGASMTNLARAGFISAQDAVGDPSRSTATCPRFEADRPDWIFATRDLALSRFGIGAVEVSDHRPLMVSVSIAGG